MGDSQGFVPQNVAELADGTEIVPESKAEEEWLSQVAENPKTTEEQKERIAKMGVLFAPTSFDINFNQNKQNNYPTDLDPQLRQMIKEA